MNKSELYQLAIDLWTDMAKHGYKSKGKSKYAEQIKDMYNQCPLCEYHHTITNEGCHYCPLFKRTGRMCMDKGSLYNRWLWTLDDPEEYSEGSLCYIDHKLVLKSREEAALAIVEAIRFWIRAEALEGGK